MLSGGPGAEGSTIIAAEREQCSVDPDATSAGRGVQRDIDRSMTGIGEAGPLVEREVGVGIPQHKCGDAAALEFLAKAAG